VNASGTVTQVTNYYPFGAPYADATAVKGANLQPYKYNGKELDLMHGLNTYDYGARQHDPILARWDRMDPLCEKYYSTSPYVYCMNNPVLLVDPNGREIFLNGSKDDQQLFLSLLQKLTNDVLALNKNGSVYIKKHQNGKLKTGAELISQMIGSKKKATINLTKSGKSEAVPDNNYNAANGTGTDVEINLNINQKPSVWVGDPEDKIGYKKEVIPSYIVLGHELVHGIRSMNGAARGCSVVTNYSYLYVINGVKFRNTTYRESLEELETVGIKSSSSKKLKTFTENNLRTEHGLKIRLNY
jgi:RHS repeat-associated protein